MSDVIHHQVKVIASVAMDGRDNSSNDSYCWHIGARKLFVPEMACFLTPARNNSSSIRPCMEVESSCYTIFPKAFYGSYSKSC